MSERGRNQVPKYSGPNIPARCSYMNSHYTTRLSRCFFSDRLTGIAERGNFHIKTHTFISGAGIVYENSGLRICMYVYSVRHLKWENP